MTLESGPGCTTLRMTTILHGFPLSANTYRVRLFLRLLGVPHEERMVDLLRGEQRRAPFTNLNPLGLVPVLEDDGGVLRDSHAIVIDLALRHGESWLPREAAGAILQWIFFDATELHHGVGLLRNHRLIGAPIDVDATTRRARAALDVMEARLADHAWLELGRPTLADIACYPFVSVLEEAGLSPSDWPHVAAWTTRIESLPGFVPMPRIPGR
ncbi:Glutathione S-transferase [Minicystis rosea]|nr:Glutathione S-transferase [Minicystis rosea]